MRRQIGGFTALSVCLVATACLTFAAAPSSAAKTSQTTRALTLYSVATAEQFVNNADDRQRGKGNNPFGNFHDATATTREHGNGPFPGDEAMFKFAVYKQGDLKKSAGSATYTCMYNFNKNAFCNASYDLKGGSLIGAGQFDFNAGTFVIAIVGGTGTYRGLRGDLQASPGPKHSQRLVFTLN